MTALSELFDETLLVLPQRRTPAPSGLRPLDGHRLSVKTLPEPAGTDWRRKLSLLTWLPRRLPALWRETGHADVVHAVVPGDIGSLGIPLALARKKRLFIRHCGTWGRPVTRADRALHRVLLRIAGRRNLVFATGGGSAPPQPGNEEIQWIFSSSLWADELRHLPSAKSWTAGKPLRLISIGRLTQGKNAAATIQAMRQIRQDHPEATLDVLGGGPELANLRSLASRLGGDDVVRFHGNQTHEQVMKALAQSHLLVFPTRVAEGFPKAVLEAMACAVPVLAPRVSVLPELLAGGRGFLLDETTPKAIAEAVRRALADPPALAQVARAAQLHVGGLTLERWRDKIGQRLEEAWNAPLREAPP